MAMFMGQYEHSIDTKGRVIIPAKYREELGENFVVTRGLDGCLFYIHRQNGRISLKSCRSFLLTRIHERCKDSFYQKQWKLF